MPAAGFKFTKGQPSSYARDDAPMFKAAREFCPTCGVQLTTKAVPLPDVVFLKVGTLDDPAAFGEPQMAIFTCDKQPFHLVAEGVPTYDKDAADVGVAYPASSPARRRAAATAAAINGASPEAPRRTPSAAAVVPPGEVTASRSCVGVSSGWDLMSSPAPSTVARASRAATSAGRPAAMPASARHSASRNT